MTEASPRADAASSPSGSGTTGGPPRTDGRPSTPDVDPEDGQSAPPRPRRTWPWFVSILAALVLVVGLVWVAGGFEHRDDLATRVPAGATFVTGPYEYSFSAATVQKTKNYKDEQIWSLVVIGTGRTTGDESISPDDDDFVVKDAASGAYEEKSARQSYGVQRDRGSSGGAMFTPGLAAIPYRLTFEFPVDAFQPGSSVIFVAWKLEWRDTSLLQVEDFRWASTNQYFRMDLPLQRLADDLD